jgi:iron complex transport system substrate-binding protein
MDEMLRLAGFTNAATRYGLKQSANVPLERLLADPPDVLLAGAPHPGAPAWAERVMRHPALARLEAHMHRAAFSERLLYCGGPVLVDTAAVLVRAREQALART